MMMASLAESRAEALGEHAQQLNLGLLLHHWRARRAVRQMLEWDDRTLSDIGVQRDEVQWASTLPLTVNATLALEDRAQRRARRRG
jgi:uncharacterized protein YjiS (DUF1127 family)